MKIVTVIGARPQFIKAAAVSNKLRKNANEIIIHTGQHYDANMSDIFFDDLGIPRPDYNLNVGSGSHAKQTAAILTGVEEILLNENPDYLMVYGDTNSTLAGALAASKINISVIHIESGLRSYNMRMPEEQNRILTDHLSELLFCPTNVSKDNLLRENIKENVYVTGDVMCDAVLCFSDSFSNDIMISRISRIIADFKNVENWYLATVHRAENTDSIDKISEILNAFEELDYKVIFPVHPRIRSVVEKLKIENKYHNIIFSDPVGYLEMLYLTKNAKKVLTDSGGLQKEAYILGTSCVTLRNQTEWVETLNGNLNILAHIESREIIEKTLHTQIDFNQKKDYYGKGDASDKICEAIINYHKGR